MKDFYCNPICFIVSTYYLEIGRRERVFKLSRNSLYRLFLIGFEFFYEFEKIYYIIYKSNKIFIFIALY